MGKYIEITSSNKETIDSGVVLVDFYAPWCGPCRALAPVIEDLAEDFDGKAKICKVNTDENQELSQKFGIRSIPNIIILKDGKIISNETGLKSKDYLTEALNKLI